MQLIHSYDIRPVIHHGIAQAYQVTGFTASPSVLGNTLRETSKESESSIYNKWFNNSLGGAIFHFVQGADDEFKFSAK